MKRIICLLTIIFCVSTSYAQEIMKVYIGERIFDEYKIEDVDSVVFNTPYDNDNYNNHEYVDLGLPSGLKWATCNIGAGAPEEYGNYYEWAETEPRDYYGKYNKYFADDYNSTNMLLKYNVNPLQGDVDNKTVLDPEDDVAHVVWGGTWRMPTDEEHKELRRNCKWEDTTLNGVNVTKITGPNGNCIYLPYNGRRMYDDFMELDKTGYYWTSSLVTKGNSWMKYFCSFASYFSVPYAFGNMLRDFGAAVRPVTE
ncbi:hypothetical protein [Xylanibacter rodentium]|uniref:Fibrobacter succinogenes major paralogous domain-containing protein n=1 Tax=Xylanibacter rodentium TaxID=2736289 RepID=A0ABX2AYQ0_9BACT|nr:hypothetical protein [Xylanibacter rodentium]NPE12663.1 hypothetical protein [Prevotella sp. PJ1A]NPE15261.1 hypothetical protein [Xylanibacter rodentium]NPE40145.1 hypothetical protein [Prevotella sp. PCJ2]